MRNVLLYSVCGLIVPQEDLPFNDLGICPDVVSDFDVNEIWLVCRGRRVMHDCMQHDPIQGQGHELLKIGNPSIFKNYLLCHLQLELATDR